MYYCYVDSPVGPLLLHGTRDALHGLSFSSGAMARQPDPAWQADEAPFRSARRQLGEYFQGRRKTFELSLAPTGTQFQMQVLAALRQIPYGETRSYADIARAVGNARAVRAVGAANGRNPIAVIIPCHRVIGSDGSLTGFGGGLDAKRFLLQLELNESGLWAGGSSDQV